MSILLTQDQKFDFMKKAAFIADKSSCNYKVGCVGVIKKTASSEKISDEFIKEKDDLVYIKSWNETLAGEMFCQDFDKAGTRLCCRQIENLKGKDFQKVCSIHAESNLIAKCAKYGVKTQGMILFLTNTPCYICAKLIIQAGISTVYYMAKHTDESGIDICLKNGIKFEQIADPFTG